MLTVEYSKGRAALGNMKLANGVPGGKKHAPYPAISKLNL